MQELPLGLANDSAENSDHWRAWHWVLAAAIGLIRFVNLGFRDLQAWDEALYAVRAEAVVRFGAWLDQSAHAIDGLYSSLHPPLHIWLTALAFELFGDGEFQARLVSAVAGALTVPAVMLLGKHVYDRPTGVLAACLYGLNPFVLFFSRQGQLDTLLVLWLTVCTIFLIRTIDNRSQRDAVLAGLALGAALLTKLFVAALLPVAFAGTFLLFRNVSWSAHSTLGGRASTYFSHLTSRFLLLRDFRTHAIAFLASATVVALPWHLWMTVRHGGGDPLFFFAQSALWERMTTGVEGNVKPLEVLYYVNQLIVLFPVGALWLIDGFRRGTPLDSRRARMVAGWFLVFFIAFTLMRTKLAVYMLPMLLPASVLAGRALWLSVTEAYERKWWAILFPGTVVCMLWAADQTWRTATKGVLGSLASLSLPADDVLAPFLRFALAACLSGGVLLLLVRLPGFARYRLHAVFCLLLAMSIGSLYQVAVTDRTMYKDGACELRMLCDQYGIQRLVVAGVGSNPQLSFYLDGADLGWRDDLHVRRITPPPDTLLYTEWLNEEMTGEDPSALLVIEKDRFIRYTTVRPAAFVPDQFQPILESRRYSAYVRASRGLANGE